MENLLFLGVPILKHIRVSNVCLPLISKLHQTFSLLYEWVHFQGKQFCHFHVHFPSQWGQILNERIYSLRSKFFSFRVDTSVQLKNEKKIAPLEVNPFFKTRAHFESDLLPRELIGWLVVLGLTAL